MTTEIQHRPVPLRKQPLVSIITPTYNHERFISQCIESVLSQTYSSWEQIVIDDGSTDGTQQIVAKYKDERIRYFRQDNLGIWNLAKTYNRGLENSQGELVAVLEGDDFWPPNKLEKQIPAFDNPDIVLSWGRVQQIDADGRVIWTGPRDFRSFRNATREDMIKRLLFHNRIPSCTVMLRRNALLSIGGFKQAEYTPYVDYPTWLELSLLGRFHALDEVLGYWRSHPLQMSSTIVASMFAGSRYSVDFLERMPQELADAVGVPVEDLRAHHQHQMMWAAFNLGRIALVNGDWREAKGNFKKALGGGLPSTKLAALLGLLCAYCKVDAEWIAAMAGQPRFKR